MAEVQRLLTPEEVVEEVTGGKPFEVPDPIQKTLAGKASIMHYQGGVFKHDPTQEAIADRIIKDQNQAREVWKHIVELHTKKVREINNRARKG